MKKIIACVLSIVWFIWSIWICQRQPIFSSEKWLSVENPYTTDHTEEPTTDIWSQVSIKENDKTIIVRLLKVFWLDYSTEKANDHKFLNYVRAIINIALWLVAFIALIITIYTFYMMFFTENEAWIKKAKWNMVGIFIALLILWLAWIIVSFIFRWYQSNWKEKEDIFNGNWTTSFNYSNNINNNQIYLTI